MNTNIWILSLKDFFTKKMLGYASIPLFFTLVVLYGLFFTLADLGLDQLQHSSIHIEQSQTTIQNGISHTESSDATYNGSGNGILKFLMENSITSWLISFLVVTVGGMLVFIVAIFVAIFIIGFLTSAILKEIQKRHYPDVELKSHGNLLSTITLSIKYILIMLMLFFILIPFYFIPVINVVAVNLPFYYLFHKFYILDVAGESLTYNTYKKMMFYRGGKIRVTTLLLYALSLIPFAALITPVFNVIVLSHTLLRSSQEALEQDSDN